MVATGWRGDGEIVFNEFGVSVWDDENILEMDGGDGCTTMRMYLISLQCIL